MMSGSEVTAQIRGLRDKVLPLPDGDFYNNAGTVMDRKGVLDAAVFHPAGNGRYFVEMRNSLLVDGTTYTGFARNGNGDRYVIDLNEVDKLPFIPQIHYPRN